jgi:hypothetical protein
MISELAYEYTHIVVFAYMVQALSRTLTVVFHICGHEHFESVIDLVAAAMQVIAIACVLVLFDNASLNSVGGIQGKLCVCVCVCVCVYFNDVYCIECCLLWYKLGLIWFLFYNSVNQYCICGGEDYLPSS